MFTCMECTNKGNSKIKISKTVKTKRNSQNLKCIQYKYKPGELTQLNLHVLKFNIF